MSTLNVDKIDPNTGTTLELGTSGDTVSLPSGATLDISASTLTPPATMPASSAANLTSIPGGNITGTIAAVSGANLTSLTATNLGSGTVPTARLGSGTASSSTVLYGDQTYKTEPSSVFGTNCWWSRTNGETRTNNTNKVFAMDVEIYDPDDVFDPSAAEYKFTAPATGTYMFFVDVYITDGSGMTESVTVLHKNGVYMSKTRYAWCITGDDITCYSGGWSFITALDADDYVQLFGSNSAADGGDQVTENRGTFFGGWRVA